MSSFTSSCINEILPENAESWEGKIFLTFDLDWCPDYVLKETLDFVEEANVCATWFATHPTPVLNRIIENPKFEIGIHPNFNPLLINGSYEKGENAQSIIKNVLEFCPKAKSVRSHSLTQSSVLSKTFYDLGLRYDCNSLIPFYSAPTITPWRDFTGMIKVPHCWEDDVHVLAEKIDCHTAIALKHPGLKTYLFHPCHIFLNSPDVKTYENYKLVLKEERRARELINKRTKGVKDHLADLLEILS